MFTVLLCTTKLAQSTSQYYFVLQSLHKVLPSTALYYSTRLAQSTLHTTSKLLHREAFTQSKLSHTEHAFTHRSSYASFYKQKFLHTGGFYTQHAFANRRFYTQQAFTHRKLLRREAFTQRSFYTQKLLHRGAFTQKHLHTKTFTRSKLSHKETFTHRSLYTEKRLHTASFHTEKPLHREAFTHSKLSHREPLHREAFTLRSVYTTKLLHRGAFTHRSCHAQRHQNLQLQNRSSAPKPEKDDLEVLYKTNKMKGISAKQKNNCWQITSATVMQPPQQDPRCPAAKDHIITHAAAAPTNLYAAITRRPAETELQSTIELRTTAPEIAEPEPRWRIDAWSSSWSAERIRAWSDHSRACSETVAPFAFPILLPRHVLFCKTQQLVHPLILRNALRERCENGDFLQKVEVEDVKTKLSCKISLKHWKLKNVKDVKPKLSCKTSLKKWKLNLWKRSFRARLASKSESWTCENEAFVRGLPQKVKVELVKTKLSCEPSLKFGKLKLWKWSLNCQFHHGTGPSMIRRQPSVFRNRRAADLPHPPSDARFVLQNTTIGVSANSRLLTKSESWRCENGDFLQKMKVEDVKTKLSCEAFLKKWKLNLWKRNFRARLPSKSESWRCESWRCESEAFVRGVLQKSER